MSNFPPLVMSSDGQLQQLQSTDDIQIPLTTRHDDLERKFRLFLQDYIQRFGYIPSLGDENSIALSVQ